MTASGMRPGDDPRGTEERFVRAIAEQVPMERVAEVYLFPPLRQGPIESGVAVLAVTEPVTEAEAGAEPAAEAGDARHVVYTATYRHTRKGPERGTWSVDVIAQADAPLDAVAAAIRGVHRRTGDGDGAEADRMSGSQFRALIGDVRSPAPPPMEGAG
jgi:hypothetical protein